MGVLVRNIKTAHRDRTSFVHSSKRETRELLTAYRGLLKEMAEDLKNFLMKSESSRKGDFKAMMEGVHSAIRKVQARSKEVRGDAREYMAQVQKELKDMAQDLEKFLADSESARKTEFHATMKEIEDAINSIVKRVESMMKDYKAEHKEAAGHWAALPERETPTEKMEEAQVATEVHHAPVHKKKGHKS